MRRSRPAALDGDVPPEENPTQAGTESDEEASTESDEAPPDDPSAANSPGEAEMEHHDKQRPVLKYHLDFARKAADQIGSMSMNILSDPLAARYAWEHISPPQVDTEHILEMLYPHSQEWHPFQSEESHKEKALDVLFVVMSMAADNNLKSVLDTWGKRVPKENLVVISNTAQTASIDHLVHESDCPLGWHWTGECCRWSEAAIVAHRLMNASNGHLQWAYFITDSAYVRPWAMAATLRGLQPDQARALVLGDFRCSTSSCKFGLCAGGGMAANVEALNQLIADDQHAEDEHAFLETHMRKCGECGRWPTLGLTEMMTAKGIERRNFEGTYPFRLNKECFDSTLLSRDTLPYGPLMYNEIKTETQMGFLEQLFEVPQAPPASVFPYPSEHLHCATYEGNVQCHTGSIESIPWDVTTDNQNCSLVD